MRILCAIYSFQFISIHFISILFSMTKITKEKGMKRKKRNITKIRKMGIKPHENVSFSCFGVYFFIHLNIAIVSISLFSFLVVMVRFLRITIFLLDKSVIVRKRFFSIGLFVAGFCCILPLILCSCCRPHSLI